MSHSVITFYHFTPLEAAEALRDEVRAYCLDHGLLGRVLLGAEGINGGLSGTAKDIQQFKQWILAKKPFSTMTFRELPADTQAYHKLVVRVRNEVVAFGVPVDFSNKASYIEPAELQRLYEQGEDFVIVDARNEYEAKVGMFEHAVVLPIDRFRDFPAAAGQLDQYKGKKMVTYCTGGIRCEKAATFLKQQGFSDVYQLQGGVINYCQQFPNTHWKGSLFVFDDRLTAGMGSAEPIAVCEHCSTKTDAVIDCHNLDCDKLFVCCTACQEKMHSCCSAACMQAPRQRPIPAPIDTRPTRAVVEHYYVKAGVALARVVDHLRLHDPISIKGTTTKFDQPLTELRDYDGNPIDHAATGQIVTLPVQQRVRAGDRIL